MKSKLILGLLLLVMLTFSMSFSQDDPIPLNVLTGNDLDIPYGDSLFINIQIATDSLFENIVTDETLPCLPETVFTYLMQVPDEEGNYFWRARSADSHNTYSAWSDAEYFVFRWNLTPTGCSLISPKNGAIIIRNR